MSFDVDSFLNQTVEGENSTFVKPVPEGEHIAFFDTPDDLASWFRNGENKEGKPWVMFQPSFVIPNDALAAELGREKVTIRHSGMFLDLTEDGRVDTTEGRNVKLGRMRKAVGLNEGPLSWTTFAGKGPVRIRVKHDSDSDDPEVKYAKVVAVTAA